MNTLQVLCLLVSVAPTVKLEVFSQFGSIIQCVDPDSSPFFEYSDYGCYCGLGGSGTPVDDLDRCCQVHDECYAYAMILRVCWTFWDNPYTEIYDYTCDKQKKVVTCTKNNNKCEMFICECDRRAAECFAKSHLNPDHVRLPSDRCE